tara:strand:+ start:5080 stop:5388 length:309 start_codon:yes stop_codon:yes gene_type:complete
VLDWPDVQAWAGDPKYADYLTVRVGDWVYSMSDRANEPDGCCITGGEFVIHDGEPTVKVQGFAVAKRWQFYPITGTPTPLFMLPVGVLRQIAYLQKGVSNGS